MKKNILLKWIKALESSKYKQIRGKLKTSNGYCPLGVLCDISKISSWKDIGKDEKHEYNIFEYCKQINYLPKEVISWAGLTKNEAKIMPSAIMVLNDNGKSKKEIIQYLKRAYKIENTN